MSNFAILSAAHHRNGSGGRGFYVGVIRKKVDISGPELLFQVIALPTNDDTDYTDLSLVSFRGYDGLVEIFVTNIERTIENETVQFGVNSWRGESFHAEAIAIIAAVREQWDSDLRGLPHV